MFNFFAGENSRNGNCYYIEGADLNHIKNVLRMKAGDRFLVSDKGVSSLCELVSADDCCAVAEIIEENYQNTELPAEIHLFQGLPKADKMELIIQKCTELGVHRIIPCEMHRCVVRIDDKKKKSKIQRWQAISESAAKQSKRSIIPEVADVLPFNLLKEIIGDFDLFIVPYENERGMEATKETLDRIRKGMKIGILIGPEGGFEEKEMSALVEKGALPLSLGSRILRTETAAITAVGMCMLHIEMNVKE